MSGDIPVSTAIAAIKKLPASATSVSIIPKKYDPKVKADWLKELTKGLLADGRSQDLMVIVTKGKNLEELAR